MTAARFVTLGETLGTYSALTAGPLMRGDSTRVSLAGSESNVAIGLARLGASAAWIGCLGDDAVGALIRRELRAEGVEVWARTVPDRPSATMLKERTDESSWRVSYARSGSAGSMLGPADVDGAVLARSTHLHLTGITLAISSSGRAAVDQALDLAGEHGLTVSFDLNYRERLWSRADAAAAFADVLPRVDILFASLDEVGLIVGGPSRGRPADVASSAHDLGDVAERVAAAGPREVVFTLGASGSFVWTAKSGGEPVPAVAAVLIDPVGAGDSFVAGYLAARIGRGLHPAAAAAFGNRVARHVVSTAGDWEGAPTSAQLAGRAGDNVTR